MCGFAGVVVWDDRYRVSPETLQKMSARIAHRGPDGEGYHINHQDPVTPERPQVALAFRRLAILDPDPRSNQPFTDGRHWLVFNGEIYNFRELRAELSRLRPDYPWRTTGDTEVLLAAYAQWGEKCVEHLNGMFAFAVWDEREKTLFLARDRMGQKPLYLACHADGLAIGFASELSALESCAWMNWPLTIDSISYLRWGYAPGMIRDVRQGVFQLGPGQKYVVRTPHAGSEGLSIWFNHDATSRPLCDDEAVRQTASLVRRAVSRQLVSDVPLGIFLSGGIDSSVIAACARAETKIDTFSISFEDARYDESKFAETVAEHLGTTHHSFRVTPDVVTDLPKLAEVFAEPFGDSSAIPTHYLARATREFVKVALSGDGGDELFGGYDRYRAMKLSARLAAGQNVTGRLIRALGELLPQGHPKSRSGRLKRFAMSFDLPAADRYAYILRIFNDGLLEELLHKRIEPQDEISSEFLDLEALHPQLDVVQTAAMVDRIIYLPDDLLTKVDRCSMLHGLEVRSPFMDHELVQFAAGLTTDQLLRGGPKRMLREAFAADLPAWVFKRKKMGFAVPIGEWFRGPLRPMLRDTLFAQHAFGRQHFNMNVVQRLVDEHEQERVDHSQRLYALLMLELWWNTVRSGSGQ
jgi:asparagine synthase (glutamine-hydrolysing)